jgi:hypothetical protein
MVRETGGETRLGLPFIQISQDIQFEDLARQVAGFNVFLQAQIKNVTENLVAGGVTSARKKIRSSVTGWGEGRMSGNYFGVSFARYGRTTGREETGFMYDSLSSSVNLATSGKTMWRGTFGWGDEALNKAPYIVYQEMGFYSTGVFDPIRTAASGIAKFTSGREKWIEGARSIPYATKEIKKRAPAAYSAALNEAIKQFKANGFKGNPDTYADIKPKLRGQEKEVLAMSVKDRRPTQMKIKPPVSLLRTYFPGG